MIYFDNAATTLPKPQPVIDAVVRAMESMGNSSRGTHESSVSASLTIHGARQKLASLFGCPKADRVVFTCNSTEALNMALWGAIQPGSHVITTDLEHNSVLRPLYRLEAEQGVRLSFAAADSLGRLDYGQLETLIQPDTTAIVCTHASNLTGNLVDLTRVGKIAKAHGLLFIVDASQTAGVFPIHMTEMNIDLLCFTGHKSLMGPQGTGGLLLREDRKLKPWKVGGTGVQTYSPTQPLELPTLLEAGTLNGHGIAGLSAAIDFVQSLGMDRIQAKEDGLMRRFYNGVSPLPSVSVYGDFSGPRTAIVALNIGSYDSGTVAHILCEDYNIAVRPGAHCAPRLHRALGTAEQGAVRFSFSWFNTESEIDLAIQAVQDLIP